MKHVAIIGDGGWGTALAMVLDGNGHSVTVWGPFPDYIESVRRQGENTLYLPGVRLPERIAWTADRQVAVANADVAVLAMPTKYYAEVMTSFAPFLPAHCRLVSVSKGFDATTRRRMSQTAEAVLGRTGVCALSGPSHAEEVSRHIPTAVVIASPDAAARREMQTLFADSRFRVYTSPDIAGVEFGGALKNVIAVAVGVSDGLGFGDNTRAALITRGLAEITRLGVALGAERATFAGLSGMGDLIVTCTSRHSRNRGVGERLGKGEKIADILTQMKQVAEGIQNCGIVRELARGLEVHVPITEEVYSIVHEGKNPRDAVASLLDREMKPE